MHLESQEKKCQDQHKIMVKGYYVKPHARRENPRKKHKRFPPPSEGGDGTRAHPEDPDDTWYKLQDPHDLRHAVPFMGNLNDAKINEAGEGRPNHHDYLDQFREDEYRYNKLNRTDFYNRAEWDDVRDDAEREKLMRSYFIRHHKYASLHRDIIRIRARLLDPTVSNVERAEMGRLLRDGATRQRRVMGEEKDGMYAPPPEDEVKAREKQDREWAIELHFIMVTRRDAQLKWDTHDDEWRRVNRAAIDANMARMNTRAAAVDRAKIARHAQDRTRINDANRARVNEQLVQMRDVFNGAIPDNAGGPDRERIEVPAFVGQDEPDFGVSGGLPGEQDREARAQELMNRGREPAQQFDLEGLREDLRHDDWEYNNDADQYFRADEDPDVVVDRRDDQLEPELVGLE